MFLCLAAGSHLCLRLRGFVRCMRSCSSGYIWPCSNKLGYWSSHVPGQMPLTKRSEPANWRFSAMFAWHRLRQSRYRHEATNSQAQNTTAVKYDRPKTTALRWSIRFREKMTPAWPYRQKCTHISTTCGNKHKSAFHCGAQGLQVRGGAAGEVESTNGSRYFSYSSLGNCRPCIFVAKNVSKCPTSFGDYRPCIFVAKMLSRNAQPHV